MGLFGLDIRRYGPIGVDLGSSQIKLLQVCGSGDRPALRHLAMPRPDGAGSGAIARLVKRMLRRGRFIGNKAICSLGNEDMKITSIRIADCQQADLRQHVISEVASGLGLDTSQYQIQFIPAGQVRQHGRIKQEVIVFAANLQAIEARIRTLDQAGLEVVGLEPAACAIVRGVYHAADGSIDPIATLDVGFSSSTVLIAQKAQVRLVKAIPIGVKTICTRIAERLAVDQGRAMTLYLDWQATGQQSGRAQLDGSIYSAIEDVAFGVLEELAGEMALCLRYYAVAFRQKLEQIFIAGGGAYNQRLPGLISNRCNCRVELIRLSAIGPQWLVAFGLAQRTMVQAGQCRKTILVSEVPERCKALS